MTMIAVYVHTSQHIKLVVYDGIWFCVFLGDARATGL